MSKIYEFFGLQQPKTVQQLLSDWDNRTEVSLGSDGHAKMYDRYAESSGLHAKLEVKETEELI